MERSWFSGTLVSPNFACRAFQKSARLAKSGSSASMSLAYSYKLQKSTKLKGLHALDLPRDTRKTQPSHRKTQLKNYTVKSPEHAPKRPNQTTKQHQNETTKLTNILRRRQARQTYSELTQTKYSITSDTHPETKPRSPSPKARTTFIHAYIGCYVYVYIS